MVRNMATLLGCCGRTVRWIPVVFIVAVVFWSYYAYVITLNYETLIAAKGRVAEAVIYLIIYHVLLFIFLWSYYKITYTDPAQPPPEFFFTREEQGEFLQAKLSGTAEMRTFLERVAKRLPLECRSFSSDIRFCEKCNLVKPDRAHHCSVCGVCILKMDHHCPWVNNCVNFSNYKYFILFLFWAEVYCVFIAATTAQYFVVLWQRPVSINFHVMFVFIVSIMFGFSVLGLLGYHIYLTLKNRSTLESFRVPTFYNTGSDKHGFDLGYKRNFEEIFGDNKLTWLLPLPTSKGDGVRYRRRLHDPKAPSYNTLPGREPSQPPTAMNWVNEDDKSSTLESHHNDRQVILTRQS